jgi:hypothetical protein
MFMIVTDAGVRVFDNKGNGLDEKAAAENARERNERAQALGIEARYVVAPFEKAEGASV